MKIESLVCPNCGAPLPTDISQSQPAECNSCGSALKLTELGAETSLLCPNCQTVNSSEQRYCTDCGQALQIDCLLCHARNRLGTVYCVNCGAHLERALARRRKMAEKRRKLREERFQIWQEKEVRQKAEKLARLLEDLDEPENHEFVLYQFNQMGVEVIEPLIETLLNDDDPDARYGSARALGQICNDHEVKGLYKARAAKALIKALVDPEPAVRYWSAEALGKCQGQTAVEPLAQLLQDKHAGVRRQARYSLEKIGGARVQEILADLDKPKGILGWIKGS